MNDYLDNLLTRNTGAQNTVQPRPISLFEPILSPFLTSPAQSINPNLVEDESFTSKPSFSNLRATEQSPSRQHLSVPDSEPGIPLSSGLDSVLHQEQIRVPQSQTRLEASSDLSQTTNHKDSQTKVQDSPASVESDAQVERLHSHKSSIFNQEEITEPKLSQPEAQIRSTKPPTIANPDTHVPNLQTPYSLKQIVGETKLESTYPQSKFVSLAPKIAQKESMPVSPIFPSIWHELPGQPIRSQLREQSELPKLIPAQPQPVQTIEELQQSTRKIGQQIDEMVQLNPLQERAPERPLPLEPQVIAPLTMKPHSEPAPFSIAPSMTSPEPTVQVTIGRIEVRTYPAQASPKKQVARAQVESLDDYLRQRSGGTR
jgi:hypothetical protein